MPLSVEEYEVAQSWTFAEQSKRETGGGEGVQIVSDYEFSNQSLLNGAHTCGQYTYKVYHVETKVPSLFRSILKSFVGSDGFQFHEEAWNAYPYCKTIITNPGYMKNNFKVVIESLHLDDCGGTENVLHKATDEIPPSEVLDIFKDSSSLLDSSMNPSKYRSVKASRGPFLDEEDWMYTTDPVMTCYKTISVHCKWFGMQNRLETLILDQYKQMLLALHQQMWCWTDLWFGMTSQDIKVLEKEVKQELDREIGSSSKRGTTLE